MFYLQVEQMKMSTVTFAYGSAAAHLCGAFHCLDVRCEMFVPFYWLLAKLILLRSCVVKLVESQLVIELSEMPLTGDEV